MHWLSFPCSNLGKNGNSWVPIPVTVPETGPSTATKMTVPSTAEEKRVKKNDVFKKLVSRLAIMGVVTPPEDLNVKFLRSLPSERDTHVEVKEICWPQTMVKTLAFLTTSGQGKFTSENLEGRSSIDGKHYWLDMIKSKAVKIEDASEKEMCAIVGAGFDWSDMAEEEIQANMARIAFSDSEYDDLLVKLDDTGFKAATYKRGLSILEGQILKYKGHEVLFSEEITLLKRSVGHKEYQMGLLRTELDKVKQEKEGFEFKIAKFEKSAKDLDQLLASQITDKSKKGFGYNVVPSPHPLILNRPTPLDLSYSGLEEFKEPEVNEYGPRDSSLKPTTGCDKESDNSKEDTGDSLKQQQKIDSKTSSKARENNDAPIIEDWVLDDEDEVEPIPKVEQKTVIPTTTKKEFVKPEKPVRRSVRYAEMYRSQKTLEETQGIGMVSKLLIPGTQTYGSKSSLNEDWPKMLILQGLVNTVRSVNTGRPFSTARQNVNTVRARGFNAVKPSAC
ncbi:hypothetical protein Tco_1003304 [Tanacetum coccineum]|uniref:Uncharacterized protein n=1 Tax=Tanacetum coccineum TaxID=301880 RepID=A0ABQ5F8Y4_9ASTR